MCKSPKIAIAALSKCVLPTHLTKLAGMSETRWMKEMIVPIGVWPARVEPNTRKTVARWWTRNSM